MSKYSEMKEKVRNEAIDWQYSFGEGPDLSYGELAEYQQYFEKMGKRYGLLEEFRENGII